MPTRSTRIHRAIVSFCEQLACSPAHGVPRDDLLAGLRVTHYRGRTVIAYRIAGGQVAVLAVYYAGQDDAAEF
ncbi:type II toxin-antitoxin system RelE/ParE family toxin [Burkholderia ubonensis]|uniref:type II toxin-antitoxin system RelE/ParE family toxin n=1 Tax=Burkholderia ubonensis TaxID=101571 RepID=UPI0039F59D47